MVKAIGIDSGTKTMDIYGFDDKNGKVLIDLAIPREEITKNPSLIIEKLKETQQTAGPIDAIVGPSGYGMPLQKARDASYADIALATFVTEADVEKKAEDCWLKRSHENDEDRRRSRGLVYAVSGSVNDGSQVQKG